MIYRTLQSILRESYYRPTGRAAFNEAVSRILIVKNDKDDRQKTAAVGEKAA